MRAFGLMLIGLTLLSGCNTGDSQHDRALAACRAQADATDNRTNRADMAQRDTSTTPLSAEGMPGFNFHSLQERDAHDTLVNDCMNGTGPLPGQ
jgi:hypothetical protein